MKSRTSLVLMEQLIMVLVFALAAALCLQVFAKADALADRTARRDEAVRIAQNAAERYKAGEEAVLENTEYFLEIQEETTDIPGLEQVNITVTWEGEALFSLTVGRQEVGQ